MHIISFIFITLIFITQIYSFFSYNGMFLSKNMLKKPFLDLLSMYFT
ncbi:hypothetical protein SAMN02910274_02831 [Bacteroides sp. AR29]|nr:hypothetical protein SAMN02910274_02831 [Bacteroides sp. AR29]